jgi:hypothetical protein
MGEETLFASIMYPSSILLLTAFALIGPMDSIKLGQITVCCIISVKLTD